MWHFKQARNMSTSDFNMDSNRLTNVNGASTGDYLLSKELRFQSKRTKRRSRRHIPHSQRPTEFVEKRNERERQRVDDMNNAYETLKGRVPFITRRTVRTSKMKILTNAISYIQYLSSMIGELDESTGSESSSADISFHDVIPRNTHLETSEMIRQSETELLESRIPPILNHTCGHLSTTETYPHQRFIPSDRSKCNQSYLPRQYWIDNHLDKNTEFSGSYNPTEFPALFEAFDYQSELGLLEDSHVRQFIRNAPQTNYEKSPLEYHDNSPLEYHDNSPLEYHDNSPLEYHDNSPLEYHDSSNENTCCFSDRAVFDFYPNEGNNACHFQTDLNSCL